MRSHLSDPLYSCIELSELPALVGISDVFKYKKKKNSRKCFPKRRQQAISFKSCQNKFGRFGFSPTLYLITLIRRLEQNNFALLEATVPVTEKCKHAKQKQTVAKSGREGKRNTRLNFFFLSSSRHPHPDE